jgi:hypothetical protein
VGEARPASGPGPVTAKVTARCPRLSSLATTAALGVPALSPAMGGC